MDEGIKILLDAHEKASQERLTMIEKMHRIEVAVFNGLAARVERIDNRLWWVISAVIALNAASAVVVIVFR